MSACIYCGGLCLDPHEERDLGRPVQPGDPCVCGHEKREHMGAAKLCWKCEEDDTVCRGFEIDLDAIEDQARAEYENQMEDDK